MDLISVIVPVYKVEKYLDRCVESIVKQSYTNLEIILVDDGSQDNCPSMCDAWAARDSRIRVIHKENGGLSDARNAGMAAASGEYIGFVDSDDWISPEMYRLLYENMQENGSDIAACGVEMVYEDGSPSQKLTPAGSCVLDNAAAMEAVVLESRLKQPVWYKLYKTALVWDVLFPVGKYHEDVFWTWQAVARAKRVSVFDTPCYFYLQRGGSIMGQAYSLKRLDALEAKLQRLCFLKNNFPSLAEMGRKDLLFTCMYHGQFALKSLDRAERKLAFSRLKSAVGECSGEIRGISATHRIWIRLARLDLRLCCRIRNILGVGL